jgi:hypothetical protein
MRRTEAWYYALAVKLGHRGFLTLAEIRYAEYVESHAARQGE